MIPDLCSLIKQAAQESCIPVIPVGITCKSIVCLYAEHAQEVITRPETLRESA